MVELWCRGAVVRAVVLGLRFLTTVARVIMSRGIVCGCGVGSYCEGRADVNNAVGGLFF